MANYTQSVFFAPKDSLSSGDPAKVIKGSEVDAQLAGISTAITTKEDSVNKGAANGYASLDSGTLVPVAQVPNLAATKITSGTLVVARGGTGVGTLAAGNLMLGAGTSAMTALAPSTTRNVCVSNGTAWTSRALEAADVPNLDTGKLTTGTLPVARGGTGVAAAGTSNNVLQSDGTNFVSRTLAAAGIAASVRAVAAGVGLSGGGDLTADRTISMGAPSTLTTSTTNSASGTTHTHSIGGGVVKSHVAGTGGQITVSTIAPSGGTNGDIWLVVA
jgi:hypothetical protein